MADDFLSHFQVVLFQKKKKKKKNMGNLACIRCMEPKAEGKESLLQTREWLCYRGHLIVTYTFVKIFHFSPKPILFY
jgi:hypothetical protein